MPRFATSITLRKFYELGHPRFWSVFLHPRQTLVSQGGGQLERRAEFQEARLVVMRRAQSPEGHVMYFPKGLPRSA